MNEETLSKLERLAKLRDQGAITQAEFDQQKAALPGTPPPMPTQIPQPVVPVDEPGPEPEPVSNPLYVASPGAYEEKPPKSSNWGKWVLIALGALFIIGFINKYSENQKAINGQSIDVSSDRQAFVADSLEVVESEKRKIDSDVNSSFILAATAIKHTLKDPDSYDEEYHQASYVGQNGVYVTCLVKYRAKNSFGGYEVAKALVNFNTSMKAIEVIPVDE